MLDKYRAMELLTIMAVKIGYMIVYALMMLFTLAFWYYLFLVVSRDLQ